MCEGDGFVMCGILGVVSKNNVSRFKTEFEIAIKNLSHRGPDHTSAVMFDNSATFFFESGIISKSPFLLATRHLHCPDTINSQVYIDQPMFLHCPDSP